MSPYHEKFPINPEYDHFGTIVSVEDWLGNRYGVDDRVLYCVPRDPRGGKMAVGVVTAIIQQGPPPEGYPQGEGIKVQILTEMDTEGRRSGNRAQWLIASNVTALTGVEARAAGVFGD